MSLPDFTFLNMDATNGISSLKKSVLDSVDFVFADPPYVRDLIRMDAKTGTQHVKCSRKRQLRGHRSDALDMVSKLPKKELMDKILAINSKILVMGGDYLLAANLIPDPKNEWFDWYTHGSIKAGYKDHIYGWTNFLSERVNFDYLFNGMVKKDPKERRRRPWQLPAAVCRFILDHFTSRGDTILEPFVGSGAFTREALVMGRKVIGFEIAPVLYANTRIWVEKHGIEQSIF